MNEKSKIYILALGLLVVFSSILYLDSPLKITGMATSQQGNLTVGVSTYIACTWSNSALDVSFGSSLDPGTDNLNATQNYNQLGNVTSYNVTNSDLSNVAVNITILGANLISGANDIGIGNITWISNSTIGNASNMVSANSIALTTTYDTTNKVASDEAIGSSVWYRFWIDLPNSTVAGTYAGNYTMQCEQAS